MRSSVAMIATLLVAGTLPQCMRVSEGIEVDVAYQPAATPAQIRTDLGYRVALDRALVVFAEVELLRCDNFVADLARLLGPARARAHVLDTPTSLGEPLVLDLMESAGIPEFVGTMKPPPGRYCGIRILGRPADEDAVGLKEENREMMHHTVLAAGRWRGASDSTGESQPWRAQVPEALVYEIELDRPLTFDRPVVQQLSIQIDHTRWFDGIDFARSSGEAVRNKITQNIRSSLKAVLPAAEDGL